MACGEGNVVRRVRNGREESAAGGVPWADADHGCRRSSGGHGVRGADRGFAHESLVFRKGDVGTQERGKHESWKIWLNGIEKIGDWMENWNCMEADEVRGEMKKGR
jgi:hypothetical protein